MLRHLLIGCLYAVVGSRLVAEELPLLVIDDFENGMTKWQTTDDNFWKITEWQEVPVVKLGSAEQEQEG